MEKEKPAEIVSYACALMHYWTGSYAEKV
jgi:hypothetical protein